MDEIAFPLRLGTRGSPLALAQAGMVAAALRAAHGWDADAIEIRPIRTSGDRIQSVALAEVGGKALWTKEIDRALLAGEIDLAVHSMKDVETHRPEAIAIAAVLPRADPRDRLIGGASLAALPPGARIGTSSPRREAQLKRFRADFRTVLFRGNVDTRLAKLAAGEADATLLAAAGLDRLGRGEVGHAIPPETMLPAPAQGIVGVEALRSRAALLCRLAAITDPPTEAALRAERALLAALGADCRSPVAAHARPTAAGLTLSAEILSPDGGECVHDRVTISAGTDASAAAADLARALLARASPALRARFTG